MYRSLRRLYRLGGIVLLVAVAVTGVCLANASPPDPSWLAGLYDDGDHDDAILAMLAIEAVVVAIVVAIEPAGLVAPLVLADVLPVPAPHVEAPHSRGPPHSPSPA
jgi:hypothetical protein